jgi:AAA domain
MPAAPRTGTRRRAGSRPAGRQSAKQAKENPLALVEDITDIEITDLVTAKFTKNIVIHGPSGHGKTILAGGVTRDYKATFLSTEPEGVVSARNAGSTAGLMRAPDWESAVSGVSKAEDTLGADDFLIVDSGTKMQILYMRWILKMENTRNPMRDLDIPAIQNYQKFQNGFMRWLDRIIDGPFNSIIITTSMSVEDAEGETRVIPQLRGTSKQPAEISDYLSAQASVGLYYAVARESVGASHDITRRALAQPYPPYWAKDRFSALGRRWDVPENYFFAMADMVAAIDQSLSESGRENGATRSRRAGGASRSRRSDG